jgi:hypothetical protein
MTHVVFVPGKDGAADRVENDRQESGKEGPDRLGSRVNEEGASFQLWLLTSPEVPHPTPCFY